MTEAARSAFRSPVPDLYAYQSYISAYQPQSPQSSSSPSSPESSPKGLSKLEQFKQRIGSPIRWMYIPEEEVYITEDMDVDERVLQISKCKRIFRDDITIQHSKTQDAKWYLQCSRYTLETYDALKTKPGWHGDIDVNNVHVILEIS